MDTCLFCFFQVFLLVSAAVTTHASLPAQVYWQSKLPNTPMPSAIRDLLRSDVGEEKAGTSVQVRKGGVNVDAGKGKGGQTTVGVGKGGVDVAAGKGKPGNTDVDVGHGGVHVNAGKGKPGGTAVDVGHKGGVNVNAGHGKTHVGVGKGGVGVVTGHKGHPVIVHVAPGKNPFVYKYAATADQLHDNPNLAYFFLEKDLHAGAKMTLRFSKSDSVGSTFLPRTVADSIPFSSSKLPEILHKFSIESESVEAETMKNTLESCEEPAAEGESKYCATSLESMVDFAESKLGKNTKPLTTTVTGKETESSDEVYSISTGIREMSSSKSITCHNEAYAYAVYLCHETHNTKAYMVPMVGKEGRKVEAVAVCHKDTSAWNPKHLAFQVLKVKPGSVPVCHFLPQDHIVWVPEAH
ncbi:BURP domain protein RD22-like [Aristolochia californica]|uniref:BURP domain protein RD22-like n=1 Tax=Aristolochia californica TaxID=171875 RepID=UPI0035E1CB98